MKKFDTQPGQPVELGPTASAVVHGSVGDADLVAATFKPNRNAIERSLHLKTDWIIDGRLTGDIIAAEGIRRSGVKMPLTRVVSDSGGSFRGSVNTSGLPIGAQGSGGIAASRLLILRCGPSAQRPT